MKIAVAFFGIPRNSNICYPSIREQVLNQLPAEAQVSCFYHLYRPQLIDNPRSGESGFLSEDNYEDFQWMEGVIEAPGECLNQWNYEQLKGFGDTWADEYASIRNLIHQLHSMREVTKLLAPSDPDFVVFVRPDIFYHNPLPNYMFAKPNLRRNNVYIPNWQWWSGLNDRFSVCGRDSYRVYGCRVEDMMDYCLTTGLSIHSERLLKYSLNKQGVRICTLSTTASRVRIDGAFAEEFFSSKRAMGRREGRGFHRKAVLRTFFDRLGFEVL